MGRDFAQQSEARSNFALSATRATVGGAGNTGEGSLAPAYRKRKATKAAMGGALNFARRRHGSSRKPRDAAQRPAVSDRQYLMPGPAFQGIANYR